MLRSDLRDYSDAYIVLKRRISVTGNENANKRNKKLTFENNALFRSCISKINKTLKLQFSYNIAKLAELL